MNTVASLKTQALRLLGRREYSRQELQQRLAAHEGTPGALVLLLDELQAKGFLSEQRVLESVLHRRAAKLGSIRIQQELQSKGLEPEAIAQALQELRSTETERARAVWCKKFNSAPVDAADQARQARFLAGRGFGAEAIRQVLKVAK